MSILNDYISGRIGFPIKHTGIAITDWEIERWKRKQKNIIHQCSLCEKEIMPDDFLQTYISNEHTVLREKGFTWEVLGFICKDCFNEISEFDSLKYG